ncbi:capsule assembly Wzi family protein [Tunturiibacter lichenicola]|uniref:capsule assembly Wzi family protein n=1 Tax=Tunturiibacter lichenicola TaxID=2051959 RepID=UPI0021B17460|nr:capsule assembly Wzi family protein [Edaphobacter lichenicola]
MRIRTSLFFAAPALLVVSTLFAQTQPTPAPGSAPVPTPEQTIPSVPPPTQQPTTTIPASTTPETAGKPVVPPAQPTPQAPYTAYDAYAPDLKPPPDRLGSAYIPMDSWVYPALNRLYGMGFVDTMYLSMRPYTRRSTLHMLLKSQDEILSSDNEQAVDILAKLLTFLSTEVPDGNVPRGLVYGLDSSYTRVLGISGPVLVDSYHLGQTINNDYGRPYQTGFNSVVGASTVNEWGPFSLYVRGEYQHAPSAVGYSQDLANELAFIDEIAYTGPLKTTPLDPILEQNPFRLVEAYASVHLLGHEISGGKSDHWFGPAAGSSMAWSNNAENTYSFQIDRVEPLNIKFLSKLLGPVRYDFFVGSLKGHMVPRDPWVHSAMFSFRPTDNLEFTFQRTVIWGGAGHAPITIHTFLHSFFDTNDTAGDEKYSRNDPGARFSDFSLSYRLPLMRRYMSFYVDSISHDDVTPISAPRRASYRTGLYLSQIPKLNKFDLRVEAVSTDPAVGPAVRGQFAYWEIVQLQGYTSNGIIMGDWIGREAKGGQAWLTYHLSGNEWIQLEYLNKKTPFNFIPDGTTQNQFKVNVVKRLGREIELNAWYQYEGWKAPIYKPGLQKDNAFSVQLTWYPKLRTYPEQR